jgi:hypothetical protein
MTIEKLRLKCNRPLFLVAVFASACTTGPAPPPMIQNMARQPVASPMISVVPPSLGCGTSQESAAIEAEIMKQRLMVAAFVCHAHEYYNDFILSYRDDLIAADAKLKNYFVRRYGPEGELDYHAFKTRLANDSMRESIKDNGGYCEIAKDAFAEASANPKITLAKVVNDSGVRFGPAATPCGAQAQGATRELLSYRLD